MARLTPLELYGARTPHEYREAQIKFLRKHRRGAVPKSTDAKPAVALEADGAMRLKCVCGDYPLVDPDAKLACCFNCGLVYEDLVLPEGMP